jgi:hypothetical protein
VWNLSGGVYGNDEPRHGDSDRRLSCVMIVVEASAMVVGVDGKIPSYRDMIHALARIGDAAVGAAADTEFVGVVAGNEGFDERRKE